MGSPYPLMDFETVTMSGVMPASSKEKNAPVRPQPIWMSSTIRSMSQRSQTSASLRSHSARATLMPPSPCTVSTITAAGVFRPEPESSRRRSNQMKSGVLPVEVVVERHRGAVHQRDAGARALEGVAGHREGAERHAVEGVRERHDRLAALDLAGQLQRRLDGVGARRAREHDLVRQVTRAQDDVLERLQEGALRRRRHVEPVRDAVPLQVVDQGAFEDRVVVPVVERSRAREEVEVLVAVLVEHAAALRPVEDGGPSRGSSCAPPTQGSRRHSGRAG